MYTVSYLIPILIYGKLPTYYLACSNCRVLPNYYCAILHTSHSRLTQVSSIHVNGWDSLTNLQRRAGGGSERLAYSNSRAGLQFEIDHFTQMEDR